MMVHTDVQVRKLTLYIKKFVHIDSTAMGHADARQVTGKFCLSCKKLPATWNILIPFTEPQYMLAKLSCICQFYREDTQIIRLYNEAMTQ